MPRRPPPTDAESSAGSIPGNLPAAPGVDRGIDSEAIDYDGAWKETLERFLPEFLALAFPAIAAEIDWSFPFRFLDTELQEVVREAESGRVRADKLVEVRRRDGIGEWILIHAEVQAQRDDALAERMFRYYYRILDRFQLPVVSVAVLADPHPFWKPSRYERLDHGCRLSFDFPICKLSEIDLTPWLDAGNPVARVIAAHRVAQSTGGDPARRQTGKLALVRSLLGSGLSEPDVREVLRLIHWLLALPAPEELSFRQELRKLQQETSMPYISTYDRLVREEGRQEGRQEGQITALREVLVEGLTLRFGPPSEELLSRIEGVWDELQLRRLVRAAFTATSPESFAQAVSADQGKKML